MSRGISCYRQLLGALVCISVCFISVMAHAQDGFRHESRLGFRASPLGINVASDTGYRLSLFESDNILLNNTYADVGVSTVLSPAFGWVGPYVEIVPLAVLKMRFSVQYLNYFGNFGHIYMPGTGDDWSTDALKNSENNGLGKSVSGMQFDGRITPQIRVGNIVAFSEFQLTKFSLDTGASYYEPLYDMYFGADEFFWVMRPTAGYLFGKDPSRTYLLLALRWEQFNTTETDISRDTLGVVWLWKVPSDWISVGSPTLSGFWGAHVKHPNRGDISPYIGTQFNMSF